VVTNKKQASQTATPEPTKARTKHTQQHPQPYSLDLHHIDLLFFQMGSLSFNRKRGCRGWVYTSFMFLANVESKGGQIGAHVVIISLKFRKTPNNVLWQARWLWAVTGTAHVLLQEWNNPRAAHSNSTVPQITHYTGHQSDAYKP
jgi:hypothetical protein